MDGRNIIYNLTAVKGGNSTFPQKGSLARVLSYDSRAKFFLPKDLGKRVTGTPTSHHFRRQNSVPWLGDAYLLQNENHLYVSFVDMLGPSLTLLCLLFSHCLRYLDPTLSLPSPTPSCSTLQTQFLCLFVYTNN